MNIGMIGLGKLGLPVALAIEKMGHDVYGYEIDLGTVNNICDRKIPYTEEGAQELLNESKLQLATPKVLFEKCDLVFVAVQTPHDPKYEGTTRIPSDRKNFDYTYLVEACKLANCTADEKVIVIISTVLPGTIEKHVLPRLRDNISIVYNPFFIAMGTTIRNYLWPEFVLLGAGDIEALKKVKDFYSKLYEWDMTNRAEAWWYRMSCRESENLPFNPPIRVMSIKSAELTKVAYNTFIGMKIVHANTMMEICQKTGANVNDVQDTLKLAKKRLTSGEYMDGGMGDGGGCHPRDNIALSWLAEKLDLSHDIFTDVMKCRQDQTEWLKNIILRYWVQHRKRIVILGKAFKPETNLTIGSPSVLLYNMLKELRSSDKASLEVVMHDPMVDDEPFEKKSGDIFFIGTKHECWKTFDFTACTVVIDPFRYIPGKENVPVLRIGEGWSPVS